jgi:NAD+ diphosphatase
MTSFLFRDQPKQTEASALTAFSQNKLDRLSENRPDGCLEDALSADEVKFYAFSNGAAYVSDGTVLHRRDAIESLNPDFENATLLGWNDQGQPRISITLNPSEPQKEELDFIYARQIYADIALPKETLGELAQAASINAWVNNSMFCGACGGPTVPKAGGYHRHCPSCDRTYFPRTDPVVIMFVVDEASDKCLMGRSPHFLPNMYSTLAGFIEQAETIEDAVRRETLEESNIKIGRVKYHASQPWPAPHSLMIGCYAEALTTEIMFDKNELEDCRWFTRDEIAERLKSSEGEDRLSPPEGAIAHRLMRDWLDM